jgi:hypothetical protein
MSRKPSEMSKSYKTGAVLFVISGIILFIVGVVSGRIGIFLPIGIALIILSIGFWKYGKKVTNNELE